MTAMMNLTGSEKQIVWATEIRDNLISYVESEVSKLRSKAVEKPARAEKYNKKAEMQETMLNWLVANATSAGWWIDHREPNFGRFAEFECPIYCWDSMVRYQTAGSTLEEALSVFTTEEFRGLK